MYEVMQGRTREVPSVWHYTITLLSHNANYKCGENLTITVCPEMNRIGFIHKNNNC